MPSKAAQRRIAREKEARKVARLRALPYSEYLASRHWREFRARVLLRWGGLCENCGGEPAREVQHHKTYERLGSERLSDLTPLCEACHESEHRSRTPRKDAGLVGSTNSRRPTHKPSRVSRR